MCHDADRASRSVERLRAVAPLARRHVQQQFRQDVFALHPPAVVVLAGTNDIVGNTGPMTLDDIEANYQSMVQLAVANGIRTGLASVLPVHDYTAAAHKCVLQRLPEKILALNRRMRAYCAGRVCLPRPFHRDGR